VLLAITREFGKSVDWLLTGKTHVEPKKRAARDSAELEQAVFLIAVHPEMGRPCWVSDSPLKVGMDKGRRSTLHKRNASVACSCRHPLQDTRSVITGLLHILNRLFTMTWIDTDLS